ncbi:MAG: DUF4332 domain-containing protein [bacterium]|nr:DUF4332 domain-containing protein [bacterium]
MAYYIDLAKITIDEYKEILASADLIPSWMILKENINKNLDIIKKQDIKNLDELQKKIKDKTRVQEFAGQSGLPEEYLSVLRRVINGYQPKPNRIQDFPCIAEDVVKKLEKSGFKKTIQVYDEILTTKKRKELSKKTGVEEDEIMKLAKLTDLSRIRWVNHTFAYVLLEAGYDTAKKVANADYKKMYVKIKQLNKEKELFKGNIGEHDMKLCVEAARVLDFDIKY